MNFVCISTLRPGTRAKIKYYYVEVVWLYVFFLRGVVRTRWAWPFNPGLDLTVPEFRIKTKYTILFPNRLEPLYILSSSVHFELTYTSLVRQSNHTNTREHANLSYCIV